MTIQELRLTNFCIFRENTFNFKPGMNLIIGINGVGKSTALNALRTLLTQTLPAFSSLRLPKTAFRLEDITIGQDYLDAIVKMQVHDTTYSYSTSKFREKYRINPKGTGIVREQVFDEPDSEIWSPKPKKVTRQDSQDNQPPLAVFFSPHRALAREGASSSAPENPQVAAFKDALSLERELRLQEFAEWWITREELAKEGLPLAQAHLDVMANAIRTFLDNFGRIQVIREPKPSLQFEKNGVLLNTFQLSDGERSVLALVLDLTRRLVLICPGSSNPAREGEAVVLIDELDLHLHPRWQRSICKRLTETFPLCQFIATTHSPQIISEVEPENIIRLAGEEHAEESFQSYGMDSNFILRHVMGTSDRKTEVADQLRDIGNLIKEEDYDGAQAKIDRLRESTGPFVELVRLQSRIDKILLLSR